MVRLNQTPMNSKGVEYLKEISIIQIDGNHTMHLMTFYVTPLDQLNRINATGNITMLCLVATVYILEHNPKFLRTPLLWPNPYHGFLE